MIRTNSRQARQNVQAYIMEHFDGCNYEIETPATFQETAAVILSIFRSEKPAEGSYSRMSEGERFADWACCIHSNRCSYTRFYSCHRGSLLSCFLL